MNIRNEDVREVVVEIPEGHTHIRCTIGLADGSALTFNEATVSNLLRAFVAVKTHPRTRRVTLRSVRLDERKNGYAEWQLLEVANEDV